MAAGDPIPSAMPAMGGYFEKPYMEFEYRGELHRVENLAGGHNGSAASACQARPPRWDEERQRWVVPVENNIIDIDLRQNRLANATFDARSRFASMRIMSSARTKYQSTGLLISNTSDRNQAPTFPVDCEFQMYIQVRLPGAPNLINIKPFRLLATGVDQWPPALGHTLSKS